MARKKKIGEKIAEVVDHIIHPHANVEAAPDPKEFGEAADEAGMFSPPRLNQESDLNNHPKFDKFKEHGGK